MSSMIQVSPLVPATVVLIVAILLLTLFGWLEWKRKSRFLIARALALLIAIGSLVAFLLRPSVKTEADSDDVIVLTSGYSKLTADSLKKIYPHFHFLTVAEAERYGTSERVSVNEVSEQKNQIRFVVGTGLPAYALPDSGFVFLKGKLPQGIIQLNIPPGILTNRTSLLSGVWNGEATTLTLIGPEGRLDSASVKSGESFSLAFTPKQQGKFLFELESGNNREALPLEIHNPVPLRILILQQYPSAETRYLKNFLIDQGHRVVMRTQLSKDNFRYEYGNEGSLSVTRITPEILSKVDLLVLANESAAKDAGAIATAVRDGLGVLWLPSESEFAKPPFGFEFVKTNLDTARLVLESQAVVLPSWPVVNSSTGASIISNKNQIIAGYKTEGAGKVGYQLVTETYAMVGKGQGKLYGHLWTKVIESLARTSVESSTVRIGNLLPIYPSDPLEIDLITTLQEPELYLDSARLPLLEHALIDGYWSTTGWAIEKGWHQLVSPKDSIARNFFVPSDQSWKALRAANLQKINSVRAHGELIQSSVGKESYQPISPLWFFVLFVLAAGFLWLAPKL